MNVHDAVIVGSGFSGLGAAIRLRAEGFSDLVVLEKAAALGGTWRENTYPGCACDVPSPLYSFSFAQNPDWSRMYSAQAEIREYLERVADSFDVRRLIRFETGFLSAKWLEPEACYTIETTAGELRARVLLLGAGPLHRPARPALPGFEDFRGKSWHSAEWDAATPLDGQRVGVVGTGASAIQLIPEIAKVAAHTVVFQRTPPWVLPRLDRPFSDREKRWFRRVPALQRALRTQIYLNQEIRAWPLLGGRPLKGIGERMGRDHLHAQVADPALRERLTPRYELGCKRVLLSNDYYPTLCRDDVTLADQGIDHFDAGGVVLRDGSRVDLDVVVLATGFAVVPTGDELPITGRGGQTLSARWSDRVEALLGIAVAGFPNLFLLLGPNTGLGHNSMIFMIESQLDLIVALLRRLRAGARWVEADGASEAAFNEDLQRRLVGTVWQSGCRSWYVDDQGRNPTVWPAFTWKYWLRTRRPRERDWRFG